MRGDGSCNDVLLEIWLYESFPKLLFVNDLRVNEVHCGSACYSWERLAGGPSLDALITTVYLCPGFLKKEDPDLMVLHAFTEGPVLFEWWPGEVIVNNYFMSLPIYKEAHGIATSCINFFRDEYIFDSLRILCNWWETRQKVTVAAVPLHDISGSNGIEYFEVTLPVNINRAPPSVRLPSLSMLWISCHCCIQEGILITLEIGVLPRLTVSNDFIVVNSR